MANNESNFMNEKPKMDFTDEKTPHDRVLIVEDAKFFVQSQYLSVQAEHFDTLFKSDCKEIKIEDVKAADFRVFLKACYPGRSEIGYENYVSIIDLACRFIARGVLDRCRIFINENNFYGLEIELLTCAAKYNLEDMKTKAVELFATNPNRNAYYHCEACREKYGAGTKCENNHPNTMKLSGYSVSQRSCDLKFGGKNRFRFLALPDDAQALMFREIIKTHKNAL